jgi:hypothetical protein
MVSKRTNVPRGTCGLCLLPWRWRQQVLPKRWYLCTRPLRSRDISFDIVTSYRLDGLGSVPGMWKRHFSASQCSDWPSGPLSFLSNRMGAGCSFLGLKRPAREADHSPPSVAKVKNGGAIPPLHHTYSWHAQLIRHKNITFHTLSKLATAITIRTFIWDVPVRIWT